MATLSELWVDDQGQDMNQVTIVVRQLMNQPGSSAGAIRVGIAFRSSTDLCGCVPHERAMCETSMKC
jgi:hypothetical protein